MPTKSIEDILGKIDQRLETLKLNDDSTPLVSLDPLSEVGLYISNDSLLADLYRQYLEAQRSYITTLQTHGEDSAMTETASYMADSSFCAMETRLIELREEKELAERVAKVQATQRDAYKAEMQKRQKAYARRGIPQPQTVKTVKTVKIVSQKPKINSALALLTFAMLLPKEEINPAFTATARDFAQAAA